MDYYQQHSSPLCTGLDAYFPNTPATSYEDKVFDNCEDYSTLSDVNYGDYQEHYDSPGTMKRPVRSAASKTPYSRMYSPSPSEESPAPRKGRPVKAGSTSKMAHYARNYRQIKKEETIMLMERNKELVHENKVLMAQKKALESHLQNLEQEMMQLRSVVNKDNQIAAIVANLGGSQSSTEVAEGGICLHIAGGRVQIEACQTCNNRVRERALACRQNLQDPLLNQPSAGLTDYF